jgi:hypothetical protein
MNDFYCFDCGKFKKLDQKVVRLNRKPICASCSARGKEAKEHPKKKRKAIYTEDRITNFISHYY